MGKNAGSEIDTRCNLESHIPCGSPIDTLKPIAYRGNQNKHGRLYLEGYCVKCKAKKEMKGAKAVTMKNKKPATTGTCPTCGTKMFKIGKAK